MSDEHLQSDMTVQQEHAKQFLKNTTAVTDDAEIREDFYRIKAIEEGGLPVDIVGVNPKLSYQNYLASNTRRGKVDTSKSEVFKEVTEERLEKFSDSPVFYFGTRVIIDLEVYYKTAFNQVYRGHIKERRRIPAGATKRSYSGELDVVEAIVREVDSCSDVGNLGELGEFNSIDATFHPEKDFSEGFLEVGGSRSKVSDCEKVKHTAGCGNADQIVRYIISDNYEKYESQCSFDGGWLWTYISDVRGSTEDDTIVVTVGTPLGKAVFPFNLTHDTDSCLWNLIEKSGGTLTSLRGMDVCIRPRGNLARTYKFKNIREADFPSHKYDGFDKKKSLQPIVTPNTDDKPLLIDGPNEIDPVGVDSEYIWTLGVPPHDRHYDSESSESNARSSRNGRGILGRITSSVGL